ncbi:MAG TPA: hypothetical protein GX743_00715 [Actinomycetales bacterium]|nr:hypothetical protein [Actinomycetales bacterium]
MRRRGILPAALALTGAAAAGVISWQRSPAVRRVNNSIAEMAEHWEGVLQRNRGGTEALHVVALGDSATQGVGASTAKAGWLPRVAAELGSRSGREVEIWNLSVSGAIASDVWREQIPRMRGLPIQPDLVTLEIGGNDATQPGRVTVESYVYVMDQILGALPPGSFVSDPPWFSVPMFGSRARRMARGVRPLIEKHGHHLLPLFDVTKKAGWGYHKFTSPDLFHPNDQGYEGWATGFLEAIEGAGWKPRER